MRQSCILGGWRRGGGGLGENPDVDLGPAEFQVPKGAGPLLLRDWSSERLLGDTGGQGGQSHGFRGDLEREHPRSGNILLQGQEEGQTGWEEKRQEREILRVCI